MNKIAQLKDEGVDGLPKEDIDMIVEEMSLPEAEDEVVIDFDDDLSFLNDPEDKLIEQEIENEPSLLEPKEKEVDLSLPEIPGADTDDFIEEEEQKEIEEKKVEPKDKWDWQAFGLPYFLNWVEDMFRNVPKHTGRDTTGVQRVMAYLKRLDKEISRAMSMDFDRVIDASKAEQAREEIHRALKRLEERYKKLLGKKFKLTANENGELVKTAATSFTGQTTVSVPFLISGLARACFSAAINSGKDINDCFNKVAKDYSLDKREQFQLRQLLSDMGYPMIMDRLNIDDEDQNPEGKDVSEFIEQYKA